MNDQKYKEIRLELNSAIQRLLKIFIEKNDCNLYTTLLLIEQAVSDHPNPEHADDLVRILVTIFQETNFSQLLTAQIQELPRQRGNDVRNAFRQICKASGRLH